MPNDPSRWWFLPWMSLATAPPTVTNRVPGDTGTNHPRGTINRSRSSMLSPAGTVAVPADASITTSCGDASRRNATPPPFCAESPYERPSPRGMPPRGGSALTVAVSDSRSPAETVTISADDGLVRPHPVSRVRPPALTMATVPCGFVARMLRPPGRGRIRATHELRRQRVAPSLLPPPRHTGCGRRCRRARRRAAFGSPPPSSRRSARCARSSQPPRSSPAPDR